MKLPKTYIFLLIFLEGFAVMAAEIMAAKLIGPFFGNSLYIWASVLGITLIALALGYFIGGYISHAYENSSERNALSAFVLGSFFLMAMPYISLNVMTSFLEKNIVLGAIVSLCLFLLPVLCFFGMSTPIFIRILNHREDTSGKISGLVYAISTFGGILATFSFGFYFLSAYGIKWPSFFLGACLLIVSYCSLFYIRIFYLLVSSFGAIFLYMFYSEKMTLGGDMELVHESEGIFGQIRVIDAPVHTYLRGTQNGRTLLVNNVSQSTAFRDKLEYDCWDWSYFFPTVASIIPRGSDAILFGLGGGTILHQFNRLGFNIDVVEIDQRIRESAINYFGVSPMANILIDDARHFINTSKKTYDVITFDMFLNETPPAHVLTLETFTKVKKMLRPNGLWMINYFGYTSGSKGKSARSILKTLLAAGFTVEIMVTPSEDESSRNIVFLASHVILDFSKIDYQEADLPKITDIRKYFLNIQDIDLKDAEVLTDARPRFDHMYIEPSLDWRKRTIEYQLKPILESEISLIK